MAGKPPPESAGAVRTRTGIILSFWVVIVFLGLPTWWRTTSISRAALPEQEMLHWADFLSDKQFYPVEVRVSAPFLPCESAEHVVANTQRLLEESNSFSVFQYQVKLVRFTERQHSDQAGHKVHTCTVSEQSLKDRKAALNIELHPRDEFSFPLSSDPLPILATYSSKDVERLPYKLAEEIEKVFAEEKAVVAYMYTVEGDSSPFLQFYTQSLPQETIEGVAKNAARAFKSSPNYHLTFSLFTAGDGPSSWDIQSALDKHIQPLVHALLSAANFSITTQVQLYSSFSPSIQPYQIEGEDGLYLRQSDLTAFINTAEWPLSPSIGTGPTINFILYVPSKAQMPLRIEGNADQGGSWLIPQWGGISIFNPPLSTNSETQSQSIIPHLGLDLIDPTFQIFSSQFLSLIGVPSTGLSSHIPLSLRLKSTERLAGLSLYHRTASNLGALARLAQHLSNIPIPRHVSELVHQSMFKLEEYRNTKSLMAVREAYLASETAFFDKAMVGQVYFPDEHKVAVYLPLLGPVGVPLLFALLRLVTTRAQAILKKGNVSRVATE